MGPATGKYHNRFFNFFKRERPYPPTDFSPERLLALAFITILLHEFFSFF